jgi:hypothetical protein
MVIAIRLTEQSSIPSKPISGRLLAVFGSAAASGAAAAGASAAGGGAGFDTTAIRIG